MGRVRTAHETDGADKGSSFKDAPTRTGFLAGHESAAQSITVKVLQGLFPKIQRLMRGHMSHMPENLYHIN